MEIYTLDSLFRRTEVVDTYESLIWTERFNDLGDFELNIKSTLESRSLFSPDTKLATNTSYRVMVIETVKDTIDDDGKHILNVKGHSLETITNDRFASDQATILNVTDTPGNVARWIFAYICIDGGLTLTDIYPFMDDDNIFPTDDIAEPTDTIVWTQKTESVYTSIQGLCSAYDLGFRIVREFDTSQLHFNIYTGRDLTTRQILLPAVVFSADLNNLQDTSLLNTIVGSKNICYVRGGTQNLITFAPGVPGEISGFDKKVMYIDVTSDIPPDIEAAGGIVKTEYLQQKGYEALAQARSSSIIDGELDQNGSYKYGTDYNLGDLVEVRDTDGNINYKRVTEQIFVDDEQGERSYPTLSLDEFTGYDTWSTETTDDTWSDIISDQWADR